MTHDAMLPINAVRIAAATGEAGTGSPSDPGE
jgi:hypothetical protein